MTPAVSFVVPCYKLARSLYRLIVWQPIYKSKYTVRRCLSRKDASQQISKIDSSPVPGNPQEIRLFMAVRNESLRLPFILEHYFSRGVDRIFVIDNDSSDGTASIVLAKKNAHLFYTKDKYAHQGYWIDLLLRRYGVGHWCLIIDADEVLIYPNYERFTLRHLCSFLDKESSNAMDCVLVDMYPDKSLDAIAYKKGTDPLLVASWFDKDSYTTGMGGPRYLNDENIVYEGPERIFGGMRKRIFGVSACLSKFPLIKFNKSMFLCAGAHFIHHARVSDIRGALLHFKYLDNFKENVQEEVTREEHWHNGAEYKEYLRVLNRIPDLNFCSSSSEKFTDSNQLVTLGIMKTSAKLDVFTRARVTQ